MNSPSVDNKWCVIAVFFAAVSLAAVSLAGCAGKGDFESGVLVEREPCSNNIGPWTGYNDFKIRNDDGTLTVFKCHFKQAVAVDTPCPGPGDPLCRSNWDRVSIGSSASTVREALGEPVNVSGIRWRYPNNNSVSIEDDVVVNIFQRSAALYTAP